MNAVYQGKIHWFWGDTNRPDYPLGNFHVPGATSELPGAGGLEPEVGVNLSYFVDDQGLRPADGPDARRRPDLDLGPGRPQGSRRPGADVRRSTPRSARCWRSTSAGSPNSIRRRSGSRRSPSFPTRPLIPASIPDGHPFLYQDRGVEYVYYANPYPLIRVPADPEQLKKIGSCEAYHVPEAGHVGWPSSSSTAVRTARCATAGRRTPSSSGRSNRTS